MEKSPLESLCERFPHIGEEILKGLDDKTIAKCTLVSKTMNTFIGKQKVFWIRKIKKYVGEDETLPEIWKKLLYQAPQEKVKMMSNAVYIFFNHPLSIECKTWTPFQIAVGVINCEFLYKFFFSVLCPL